MYHATQYITFLVRNGFTFILSFTKNLPAGSEVKSRGLSSNITTLPVFRCKLKNIMLNVIKELHATGMDLLPWRTRVISYHTFIKTGESSLNKLVPLRSTLNMGTLSFPSKFVRSLTLHLPTGVCLFSLLPVTGRYYLLHFLPSTISDSTARGRVKSLLTIQKKSLPLKFEGFTSRSVAAMLCFLHLIYNGEEHVLHTT